MLISNEYLPEKQQSQNNQFANICHLLEISRERLDVSGDALRCLLSPKRV